MKKRMVLALPLFTLFIGTAFLISGCSESQEVELGPETNSRIQKGEEAQKKLSRQTQLDSEVQKLEEQMEDWIEKASTVTPPPKDNIRVFGFVKSETDCSLRVEAPYIDNRTFAEALQGMARAYPNCQSITVIADRIHVPSTQTLSSGGKDLTLIADVIDLDGTISTEGIPVGANENGKSGGDLHIYTLALRSGPGGRLITKGSNAGAFRYEPVKISENKTNKLRAAAQKKGVTFKQKVQTREAIDTTKLQPNNPKLGEAFLSVADSAQEYLKNLHPGYTGRAPNPFRKNTRTIKIDGRAYYWKIQQEQIEVTPIANENLVIEVPQIEPEYFREGGRAGNLKVFVASKLETRTPDIESHAGTDAIESLPSYSEWVTETLKDPISVKHKDQIRYTFELWKNNSVKDVRMKSWTVTRPAETEYETVKPRIKLQTRVIDRQVEPSVNTSDVKSVETSIFSEGDASFINELMASDALESGNLPDGIKNLKAWQKDWTDLEARAKHLGLTVKRKAK